jgi:hypothetical protein
MRKSTITESEISNLRTQLGDLGTDRNIMLGLKLLSREKDCDYRIGLKWPRIEARPPLRSSGQSS